MMEYDMACVYPTRSEGRPSHPLMPTIYLDGMAACFGSLARQFAGNAVNGAGRNGPAQQPPASLPEFASLEDAQYVQAVIEAVRASSREKTWTKVTKLKPVPGKEDQKAKATAGGQRRRM